MISIGSKELKVIKPAAKVVQFWNEKSRNSISEWSNLQGSLQFPTCFQNAIELFNH